MRFILCYFFFIAYFVHPQSGYLISEVNFLPGEKGYDLYYSYRIPYNRVVFEKAEKGFSSEYEVMMELWDSTGSSVIQRVIGGEGVAASTYEATNSEALYSEGLLYLNVPPGKYLIKTIFSDKKNTSEFKLPERELVLDDLENTAFLSPLVTYSAMSECNDSMMYRLANFEESIPFSEEPFQIILPVYDSTLEKIAVEIIKKDSVFWTGIIDKKITGNIRLIECGTVSLDIQNKNSAASYFILSGVSGLLPEGIYSLKVSDLKEEEKFFQLTVKWFNRPLSLSDPEYAIIALKYIESESKIESLLDNDDSDYRTFLNEYWAKSDPTPDTKFNPLMNEFYGRIDYAARNFATLNKDGVSSDRGMIFIKYGKPVKVERSYRGSGHTSETWLYQTNKFIFVDQKGTGEFLLVKE